MTAEQWMRYVRIGELEARPYTPGEQNEPGWRQRIALSPEDMKLPTLDGGMIARNPENRDDQWYINANYFAKNYALARAEILSLQVDVSVTQGEKPNG